MGSFADGDPLSPKSPGSPPATATVDSDDEHVDQSVFEDAALAAFCEAALDAVRGAGFDDPRWAVPAAAARPSLSRQGSRLTRQGSSSGGGGGSFDGGASCGVSRNSSDSEPDSPLTAASGTTAAVMTTTTTTTSKLKATPIAGEFAGGGRTVRGRDLKRQLLVSPAAPATPEGGGGGGGGGNGGGVGEGSEPATGAGAPPSTGGRRPISRGRSVVSSSWAAKVESAPAFHIAHPRIVLHGVHFFPRKDDAFSLLITFCAVARVLLIRSIPVPRPLRRGQGGCGLGGEARRHGRRLGHWGGSALGAPVGGAATGAAGDLVPARGPAPRRHGRESRGRGGRGRGCDRRRLPNQCRCWWQRRRRRRRWSGPKRGCRRGRRGRASPGRGDGGPRSCGGGVRWCQARGGVQGPRTRRVHRRGPRTGPW